MDLSTDVAQLKGVGKETLKLLNKLDIYSVGDLLFFIPRDYKDFSQLTSVAVMRPGQVSLLGQFTSVQSRYARRGLHITTATFRDKSGEFTITWFNQPWRKDALPLNVEVYVAGELKLGKHRFTIANPVVELAKEVQLHTGRIVPIYKQIQGLKTAKIRGLLAQALASVQPGSYLPQKLLSIDTGKQLQQIHFPDSMNSLNEAIHTWQLLDLFDQVLLGYLLRRELAKLSAQPLRVDQSQLKNFVAELPFTLTDSQRKASWEIIQDIEKVEPMNRLLQGDVGSGKTITALFAAFVALEAGSQVAVVAPTEVVARQHAVSAKEVLPDYKVKLLSSSSTPRQKSLIKNDLKTNKQKLIIGTHALLQPDVSFANLGLLIIDEQHRFGVKQRQALAKSKAKIPHVLSMTATPIPRTLALTVFADLDVSVINELPPGRKLPKTDVGGPRLRKTAYKKINEQVALGHQVFVVCPLINESDTLGATSVEQEYTKLHKEFPSLTINQLHGGLSTEQKNQAIEDFIKKKTDILVATTVVEVGVDIPNATVMIIEGAERFGLAQLHQLRGRIGRSKAQAYCFALTSKSGQATERLSAFASTTDGFKLAEYDLTQRGGGELYGLAQSGFVDLDISILADPQAISKARTLAKAFMESYTVDAFDFLKFRLERIKHTVKRN